MNLTDDQLLILINAGYSDEHILEFAHENTKPADLYGAVADVVTNALHGDPDLLEILKQADADSPIGKFYKTLEIIAKDEIAGDVATWWASMGITRADTKKIVMTYLYGSTEYGNRDSIQERIEKRADECMEKALDPYFDRSGADVWKEHRTKAVTIMVRLTRGAMAIVCPSTVETMDTLQEWAEILGAQDKPFKVTSCLNFTTTQANPNTVRKEVEIREGGRKIASMYYRENATDGKRLNERKMKAGAAPNGIHTCDASHLESATDECTSEFYHHIHDSMATQCADTPELAYCIRHSFCEMYADRDVLFEIWEANGGAENGLPEPQELGDLNVEDVMMSRYFFS